MIWDELVTGVRKRLRGTEDQVVTLVGALGKLTDEEHGPGADETLLLLTMLTVGLDELREACDELLTGLDALAIVMRELTTKEKPEGS